MAELFKAKPLLQQLSDKETLKLIDGSNYATNTEGIDPGDVLTRSLKLTNSLGVVEAVLPMTLIDDDGKYYVNYAIVKDRYFKMELTLTFTSIANKVGTVPVVTTGFYDYAFLEIMKNNGGDCSNCNRNAICSDIGWSAHALRAAVQFGSRELGVLAQNNIDEANRIINNVNNC